MKPITGTFFSFHHHNLKEGVHWNPVVANFTDAQWEAQIDEMAELGMKYIVTMFSAIYYEDKQWAYFDCDFLPKADIACKDPMGLLLRKCEEHGMKVFVSCGFYGQWDDTMNNMTSPEVQARAFKAMKQIYDQYGKSEAFYGWYLPDETGIYPYYTEEFIKYVNEYTAYGKSIDPNLKVIIAPYGTNSLKADDYFVEQLKRLDCDIIAYQDEIGVQKAKPEETRAYFKALREAHDKAGKSKLWADMEVFEFEGQVYHSALYAAEFDRIKTQLESISDYVDEVLIFQYQGMFNKPGSIAYCGRSESIKLYEDYKNWLDENK